MEHYGAGRENKKNVTAFVKYLCALFLFGLNGIVASHIALSSYEIVFLRTLIGSILLICVFFLSRGRFHWKKYKQDFIFVILSGFAMGASWMFLYEAYQQIGVSYASLLYYCGPVIVMIFSPLMFKEKLTMPKVVGFLIVLFGIMLVNGKMTVSEGNRWGLLCGALSAVMYFFMVTMNKQSHKIVGMENAVIQLTVSFLTVAVFVGIKQAFVIKVPTSSWPWILLLGLVNTGLGCYLYFSPLSKIQALLQPDPVGILQKQRLLLTAERLDFLSQVLVPLLGVSLFEQVLLQRLKSGIDLCHPWPRSRNSRSNLHSASGWDAGHHGTGISPCRGDLAAAHTS